MNVVGIKQKPRVADHFGQGRTVGNRHWSAASHRLERREAKAAKAGQATTAGVPAGSEGDDSDPASRTGPESGSP